MTLKQQLGAIKLVPSGGGVFEVSVNGKLIYSKKATGKFPEPDAIFREVKSRV